MLLLFPWLIFQGFSFLLEFCKNLGFVDSRHLFSLSLISVLIIIDFPGGSDGSLPIMWEAWVQSLGWEDPLENEMATHSSILAWEIPRTEEPCGLWSMGSLRVRHDWATSLSLFTFMHWRRKWQPTPVFLLEKSQGQRSLVGYSPWGHRRLRHDLKTKSQETYYLI